MKLDFKQKWVKTLEDLSPFLLTFPQLEVMMMPRAARVVFEGVVHHITQRGNYRQNVFEDSADRKKYIQFVGEYCTKYQMKIYAYCLMTNHVHFLAAPLRRDSLAMTFKYTNMRYSSYFNKKNRRSGHLWQGRFYSCPLHHDHALEVFFGTDSIIYIPVNSTSFSQNRSAVTGSPVSDKTVFQTANILKRRGACRRPVLVCYCSIPR